MRYILLTLLTIALSSCSRQKSSSWQELGSWTGLRNGVTEYTLVDNELKMKFVLDSARINISAFDFSGNLMWKTDAWLDNKLVVHKVDRPTIVYYSFLDQGVENKDVITITYSSSQFGTVDRRTGEFKSLGKD
jgi:hypothetical protein